jgi:hypothetical protein
MRKMLELTPFWIYRAKKDRIDAAKQNGIEQQAEQEGLSHMLGSFT